MAWQESMIEVEKWCQDYFQRLYEHIEWKLTPELRGKTWKEAKIDFLFSVPTTWDPTGDTVRRFRSTVERAGFGAHRSHSVSIGLTEAEAAACHVSQEASATFRERDVLLVCDAGGGTTDLSVLRVSGAYTGAITLEQLDTVFGREIGSTAIDLNFIDLIQSRLEAAERVCSLQLSPDRAAYEMVKGAQFQNIKCSHGSPDDTPVFTIPVPGLSRHYRSEECGISNGEILFAREEMRRLFDKQMEKMFSLIDEQLKALGEKWPSWHVVSSQSTIMFFPPSLIFADAFGPFRGLGQFAVRPGAPAKPLQIRVIRSTAQCHEHESQYCTRSSTCSVQRNGSRSRPSAKWQSHSWMALLSSIVWDTLQRALRQKESKSSFGNDNSRPSRWKIVYRE